MKEYKTAQLTYLVTDEPADLSKLRDLTLGAVIPDVLKAIQKEILSDNVPKVVAKVLDVLELHDVSRMFLAPILDTVIYKFKEINDGVLRSYNDLFNRSLGKAFSTYKDGIASEYFLENIRISDMKAKL